MLHLRAITTIKMQIQLENKVHIFEIHTRCCLERPRGNKYILVGV